MTRTFDPTPLDPALVDDLLDLARRAPSAGYSQGVHFLVLTGATVADFWQHHRCATSWFDDRRVLPAPVRGAAARRPRAPTPRATPRATRPATGWRSPPTGTVPFWLTDAAMAAQNLLLLAEDARSGRAVLRHLPQRPSTARPTSVCPQHVLQVGAVALGHRAADRRAVAARPRTRPRRDAHRRRAPQRW